LRPEIGINALARLVSRPQVIAERLDHVVGRYGDVGDTAFDHAQDGREYAPDGGDLVAISIPR